MCETPETAPAPPGISVLVAFHLPILFLSFFLKKCRCVSKSKSIYNIKIQANLYENSVNEKMKSSGGKPFPVFDDSSAVAAGTKLLSRRCFPAVRWLQIAIP